MVSGTEGAERTSGFRTIQIYPKDFPAVLQQVECGGKPRLSRHLPNWVVLAMPDDRREETSCRISDDGNSLRFWLAWPLHGQGCLVLSHVFPELAYFGMPPTKRKKQFIWEQYAE